MKVMCVCVWSAGEPAASEQDEGSRREARRLWSGYRGAGRPTGLVR